LTYGIWQVAKRLAAERDLTYGIWQVAKRLAATPPMPSAATSRHDNTSHALSSMAMSGEWGAEGELDTDGERRGAEAGGHTSLTEEVTDPKKLKEDTSICRGPPLSNGFRFAIWPLRVGGRAPGGGGGRGGGDMHQLPVGGEAGIEIALKLRVGSLDQEPLQTNVSASHTYTHTCM